MSVLWSCGGHHYSTLYISIVCRLILTHTHTHTDSLSCAGMQAGRSSSRVLSGESEHLIGSRWADGPSLCSAPPTQAPPHPLLSETIQTYPSPADKHTKTQIYEIDVSVDIGAIMIWKKLSSYANNKSYVSAEGPATLFKFRSSY